MLRWFRKPAGIIPVALYVCPVAFGQAEPPTSRPTVQQTTLVEGQVFDHVGAGVRDVKVTALRPASDAAEPIELATATTNDTGDFLLSLPGRVSGQVLISIAKPGFTAVTREIEVDPDDEFPPFVDVQLAGAAVLAGVVRDFRTEKAIAEATVRISFGYTKRETKTDAAGTFQLDELPPGSARITVEAAGYGRERREIAAVTGASPLEVALKPERIIHLRTVDDQGKPVGSVVVECLDEGRQDYRSLATDAGGELTIANLHYDTQRLALRLSHRAYVSSEGFDREIELPTDQVVSNHTLTLQAAGSIAGRIIDRATGEPVNGARVMAGRYAYGRCPRDFTGFDGAYRIDGVEPGQQPVTVYARGYAAELAQVEVTAGQEATLDVKLDPSAQVGGTVVDTDGKALPGVHVMAVKWRGHETLTLQAMTDQDGTFVISDAPTDEFLITLLHPGHEPLLEQPVHQPKTDYRFAMTPGGPGGQPGATLEVGDQAPPFELTTLDGRSLNLADLEGKTVFLDFWATWCPPCVAEMPNVKKVHDAFAGDDDFVLIGISLDTDERALRRFIKDQKIAWPQVFGPKSGAEKASRDYGAFAIPATFLIDPKGKIKATNLHGPGMKDRIAKLLDE